MLTQNPKEEKKEFQRIKKFMFGAPSVIIEQLVFIHFKILCTVIITSEY